MGHPECDQQRLEEPGACQASPNLLNYLENSVFNFGMTYNGWVYPRIVSKLTYIYYTGKGRDNSKDVYS